jgi:hypothetical protein
LSKLRLAISALTKTAFVGRVNKTGDCFLDGKQDVSSDFFKAVIDYFGGCEAVIKEASGDRWKIRCVKMRKKRTSKS